MMFLSINGHICISWLLIGIMCMGAFLIRCAEQLVHVKGII